jgi:hypothetical protein
MRRTSYLLLILLFFASCTTKRNDLTSIGLRGKVKQNTVKNYYCKLEFGDPVKGDLDFVDKTTYNEDGNHTELSRYNDDGSLRNRTKYRYDAKGNRVKEEVYSSDGELVVSSEFSWKREKSKDVITSVDLLTKSKTIVTVNYNSKGLIDVQNFNFRGSVNKSTHKYDAKGNEIETNQYGTIYHTTYLEFYKDGNWKSRWITWRLGNTDMYTWQEQELEFYQ